MLLLVVVSISTRVAVAVAVLVACPRCFVETMRLQGKYNRINVY